MRSTIALHCILKNEISHLPRFLENVDGLFDKIYLCDTGSTDGSIEFIESVKEKYNIELSHFKWVDDFAAARNFVLKQVKEEFACFLDLDDSITDKEAFKVWRDNSMHMADMWLNTYHYAYAGETPVCSFARERVVRVSKGFEWRYFCHEGMTPADGQKIVGNFVPTWAVRHHRTMEDLQKDKGRNLRLFELNKDNLDARMQYYYGKELFENGQNESAVFQLLSATSKPNLEHHDRILALQYAAFALNKLEKFDKAVEVCLMGIHLVPTRAEFHVMIADAYAKKGNFQAAIVYYSAAANCATNKQQNSGFSDVIFKHMDAYGPYPRKMLARCYFQIGQIKDAEREARLAVRVSNDDESKAILAEIRRVKAAATSYKKAQLVPKTVAITCLGGLYEWDAEIAKTRGVGGSEIAAIKMGEEFARAGFSVKIFNERKEEKIVDGVHYVPLSKMHDYFSKHKPELHIAWRHNVKLTDAKTYMWLHDLFIPQGEQTKNYEKALVLSEFHKNYVSTLFGVPSEKLFVTSNGIDPKRFDGLNKTKNPLKIVFASSPDRGLDTAIQVLDLVRQKHAVELHVFYGFDNMIKMGKTKEVDHYMSLIQSREWVKLHGNVAQSELPKHYQDAAIWLYPTNFLETNCITAVEMILCGVYPVVRKYGALPDTLGPYIKKGMASCLDVEPTSLGGLMEYAKEVERVIEAKAWEKIDARPEDHSWTKICEQWVQNFAN